VMNVWGHPDRIGWLLASKDGRGSLTVDSNDGVVVLADVVDHRTLIFDKPDPNPTRSFLSGGKAPPGAKRYRDQR